MERERKSEGLDGLGEYYRLIPRGKGFPLPCVPTDRDEGDDASYTAQANRWRRELLEAYGYTTGRANEKARIFSVKAAFINGLPEDPVPAKRALKLLVCDQTTLFEDDDPYYRSNRINRVFISEQKKHNREYREHKTECVDAALRCYPLTPPPCAKILLNEIVEEAAGKRISVYDWLYSKKHLRKGVEKSARGEIPIWDVEKLDLDRCRADCERLLFECGQDPEMKELDFESFICLAVTSYIHEQEALKTRCPEASAYRNQSMDPYTVPAMEQRLARLEGLEEEFERPIPLTENLYRLDYWDAAGRAHPKTERTLPAVVRVIRHFFAAIQISAVCSDSFVQRICWALNLPLKGNTPSQDIPSHMLPVFLLNMVMACQDKIFQDLINDAVQPCDILTKAPLWFPRIDQAKQRYAQLCLLHDLCQILCLSSEETLANMREYVGLYGKGMLCLEELTLWRHLLGENYERLPQIGFQLCFFDYCMQCVPSRYEHLNYHPLSKLHQGGYYRFYRENEQLLRELSKQRCPQNKPAVNRYKAAWTKPELRGKALEALLLQLEETLPIDLSLFRIDEDCDRNELRLLVLETILQMQIERDATAALIKGFSTIYQVPLATACGRRVLADPDGGGDGRG